MPPTSWHADQRARDAAGLRREERATALVLARVVGRRGQRDHHLGAGAGEVSRRVRVVEAPSSHGVGRPEVLADRDPDPAARHLDDDRPVARGEVAGLVEDVVRREEPLRVHGFDAAVPDEDGRVVDRPPRRGRVAGRGPQEGRRPGAEVPCEVGHGGLRRPDHPVPEEQVPRRVPDHGQLGDHEQVGALRLRSLPGPPDAFGVAADVPGRGVDLRDRDPHAVSRLAGWGRHRLRGV